MGCQVNANAWGTATSKSPWKTQCPAGSIWEMRSCGPAACSLRCRWKPALYLATIARRSSSHSSPLTFPSWASQPATCSSPAPWPPSTGDWTRALALPLSLNPGLVSCVHLGQGLHSNRKAGSVFQPISLQGQSVRERISSLAVQMFIQQESPTVASEPHPRQVMLGTQW